MTNTAKRDFSEAAETWDDNPMRVQLAGAIVAAIVDRIEISSVTDALDYGAGTGLVTLGLQPHLRSILAADSAHGMLEMLDKKISESALPNVKTTLLDLEHDPVPEERFDLIVSSMTMHHIADVAQMIGRFCEMLRSGGQLAIADLDLDDGDFHPDPMGVRHNGLDRDQITKVFADCGLIEIAVSTAHTLVKEVSGKGSREFSVFLITGKKT